MNTPTTIAIGLLRHGETEGGMRYRGRLDDRLTEAGWRQMHAALADSPTWDRIISSPLARCAAFARSYAAKHRLALYLDDRLREIDFGNWEGRTAAEIMEMSPEALLDFWQDPWTHGPPGGEPLAQMCDRVLAAWREIVADGRATLLIGHGGPMRVILCHVLRLPLARLMHVEVAPAALHHLVVSAYDASLVEASLP